MSSATDVTTAMASRVDTPIEDGWSERRTSWGRPQQQVRHNCKCCRGAQVPGRDRVGIIWALHFGRIQGAAIGGYVVVMEHN